jgi:hypothetical protein
MGQYQFIAIDPSISEIGVAVFEGHEITRVKRIKGPKTVGASEGKRMQLLMGHMHHELWSYMTLGARYGGWDLVIEWPEVYVSGRSDPNDLLLLAGVVGAIVGQFDWRGVYSYRPKDWKGQVPKEIHNDRVLQKLSQKIQTDLGRIPKTYRHNVIDACGLALHHKDLLP